MKVKLQINYPNEPSRVEILDNSSIPNVIKEIFLNFRAAELITKYDTYYENWEVLSW